MRHMRCALCGKEITDREDFTSFGGDGDFVHYKCWENKDNYFTAIDVMNDKAFENYMTGKKELNV